MKKFTEFPISDLTLEALNRINITETTSVQEQSLPAMLSGRDLIAQAPTGTGKTFAFGIPIIEHCREDNPHIQALILAPTRELVQQIEREIRQLAVTRPWLETVPVFGGAGMRSQTQALKQNPAIVIATPGRLIDHLRRKNIRLNNIEMLILDEADRMLDMGFIQDVRYIMDQVPKSAMTGLFSATLSREVMDISWIYQKNAFEVKVRAVETDKPKIKEYYVIANGSERIKAIKDIMEEQDCQRALVFVNMKQSADITARKLKDEGFSADALQGDMVQTQRNKVMRAFRESDIDILVGTDVAARGLDIEDVEIVFNYDLPAESENYIHRIGRTGRARREGIAISFVAPGTETAFDQFCRKLHINPERYPWEAPETDNQISAEEEAAIVRKIRAKSQYLRNTDPETRYDALNPLSSRRSYKSKGGRPARRSDKSRKGRGKRSNEKR